MDVLAGLGKSAGDGGGQGGLLLGRGWGGVATATTGCVCRRGRGS